MGTYTTPDGFKITITTDADKAKREIESLAESTRRAARKLSFYEQEEIRGGGSPSSPNSPSPYKHRRHTGLYYASTTEWGKKLGLDSHELGKQKFASPWDARKEGIEQARAIRKELTDGAKAIGAAIGYFIIRDIGKTYFMSKYQVGGNNTALEKTEGMFNSGVSSFGSAMSAIGGSLLTLSSLGMKVKHPYALGGAAIAGALGWGLTSAFNTGKQHDIMNERKMEEESLVFKMQRRRANRAYGFQASDYALQRLSETASGRGERISLAKKEEHIAERFHNYYRKEYDKMLNGVGGYKIGDAFTKKGLETKEKRDEYFQRFQSAKVNRLRVEDMNLPTPASASNYADTLSARGIFVGAQVDVRSVQHEMLDQLKFQREKWEKQIRILDEISSSLRKRDFMRSKRTGEKVAM